MNVKRRALIALSVSLTLGSIVSAAAYAAAYPDRLIRLIAPYPAGGPTDILARLIAANLSEMLHQQVVVENKAGAGGAIGVDSVAKAPADGYTLVLASSGPFVINPALQTLPYDPVRDFTPIALIGKIPTVLVVNPALPVRTVQDLVDYAREHPGKLNFGSTGTGATPHLAGELLKSMAQLDIRHVPYRGSAPALIDLMGGQIDFMFDGVSAVLPKVKSGRLRAIAVGSAARLKALPQLPTVAESGMAGFDVVPWYGVLGPAKLPQDVVDTLNAALIKVVAMPGVIEKMAAIGAEPTAAPPQVLAQTISSELPRWKKLIAEANIKAE